MPTLLITGNRSGAGKTSLAAALLLLSAQAGRPGAYWKPFSPSPAGADADVEFVGGVLADPLGLPPVPAPSISPMPPFRRTVLMGLQRQLAELRAQRDLVIVEVANLTAASQLADALDAKVLLAHPYVARDLRDAVAPAADGFGSRLAGVVLNSIPPYREAGIHEQLRGLHSLVVLPESRVMVTATVAEIAAHLGGEWVLEPVNTGAHVERYMIGGNIMDSGPNYFGRYSNQAVITRTQRPDIQMACLDHNPRCLILTGPGETNGYIKAEALERDIPLIRVQSSTLDTAEALGGLLRQTTVYSLPKIQHFAGLLAAHVPADTLEAWLS